MKKTLLFSLLATALIVIVPGCGKKAEKAEAENVGSEQPKYTSEEGNFKIAFPGEPTVTTESVPTEIGDIQMKMYMYEKGKDEAYMVAYSDYPQEVVDAGDKKEMLEGSKQGVVGNIGATIEEENDIEINGNPGVYFKAKGPEFATVYKLYLVKNRLYQIGILKAAAYPSDADIKGFLDSFELIRK
ncbi:MAG: hypothetical protein N2167_04215 [Flavobacteriales bacterium]|nr:hypothetical protein [Flavobacteriales bacterium]